MTNEISTDNPYQSLRAKFEKSYNTIRKKLLQKIQPDINQANEEQRELARNHLRSLSTSLNPERPFYDKSQSFINSELARVDSGFKPFTLFDQEEEYQSQTHHKIGRLNLETNIDKDSNPIPCHTINSQKVLITQWRLPGKKRDQDIDLGGGISNIWDVSIPPSPRSVSSFFDTLEESPQNVVKEVFSHYGIELDLDIFDLTDAQEIRARLPNLAEEIKEKFESFEDIIIPPYCPQGLFSLLLGALHQNFKDRERIYLDFTSYEDSCNRKVSFFSGGSQELTKRREINLGKSLDYLQNYVEELSQKLESE